MQQLFPLERITRIAQRVVTNVDFDAISERWKLPMEFTIDFCLLALFDIVLYVDDSLSMAGPRWDEELREIVERTTTMATLFDDDGISVRFMNADVVGDNIRTKRDVMDLLRTVRPYNGTPI
eukprot:EG_transcript_55079